MFQNRISTLAKRRHRLDLNSNETCNRVKLSLLKLKILFKNVSSPNQKGILVNAPYQPFIDYRNKNLSSVYVIYNILLRTIFTSYWSHGVMNDIRALYDQDTDTLDYTSSAAAGSQKCLINFLIEVAFSIPSTFSSFKSNKSGIKLITDFNAFKGYKPKSRLTWELLNLKAGLNNYKAELFFLKSIFKDVGRDATYEDADLFYGVVYMLIYISHIKYTSTGEFINLRVDSKRNLIRIAAFSFRILTTELVSNFIELSSAND